MPWRSEKETICITVRCYVPRDEASGSFEIGKTMHQRYPKETTLNDVMGRLGIDSVEIGLVAVNRRLAERMDLLLADGDHVDIFPLLQGG